MSVASVDLGTHGVRAALLARGRPRSVIIGAEGAEMASAVAFGTGAPIVGARALRRAVTHPSSTVRAFLPILGSAPYAPRLIQWVARAGLRMPPTGEATLLIEDTRVPIVDLVTLLLRPALAAAAQAGGEVTRLMMAVQGWLEPDARRALLTAARAAGVVEAHAVDGAIAAVASLGRPEREQVVAIVDVGAAAVTASIVSAGPQAFRRLAFEVATGAGGDAVDLALVEAAMARHGLARTKPAAEMLRQAFEGMKRDLALDERVTFPLPLLALGGSSADNLSLDASTFSEALSPSLRVIARTCAAVLPTVGEGGGGLDKLYLAGGMGNVGAVQDEVARAFGRKVDRVLPVGAAAAGAALLPPPEAPRRRRSTQSLRAARPARAPSARPPSSPPDRRVRETLPPAPASQRPDSVEDSGFRSRPAPPRSRGEAPSSRLGVPRAKAPSSRPRAKAPSSRPGATKPPLDFMPRADAPRARPASREPSPPPPPSAKRRATSRPEPHPAQVESPPASMPPAPGVIFSQGRVENPTRVADVLALPMRRPAGEVDAERVALPVLLHVLSRQKTTGTLVVTMDGAARLQLPCDEGRFSMAPSEHQAVIAAFRSAAGSWHLEQIAPPSRRRTPVNTRRLVVEGLRKLVWSFDESELVAAFGPRMARAPKAASVEDRRVQRLGLSPAELRLVKFGLDGRQSSERLIAHAGAGRLTALFVLVLLTLYGLIEWGEPEKRRGSSPEEQVRKRAAEATQQNAFEVLGLHWSADDDEVREAYRECLTHVQPGGLWDAADSDACFRVRARIEEAWETLRHPGRRAAHRSDAYPTVSYDMLADLLTAKAKAMTLRDDEGSKREYERIAELRRTERRLQSGRVFRGDNDDDDEAETG